MTSTEKDPHGQREPVENTRPGVLGDGTEEQNLNQKGHPEARIKKDEVQDAFGKKNNE
ncbi:hypothetical protein [uncultured Brevundimonas sp.]|uniref:hypothetical protein n=1 Tax=uncultured Brevundimonas sp. TaxID=213418 RepID=UPI0026263284|nr:hypothetical protein [uncultured Brevundimonas sp.]